MSFITSLSDLGVILCWFVDILIIASEMKEMQVRNVIFFQKILYIKQYTRIERFSRFSISLLCESRFAW